MAVSLDEIDMQLLTELQDDADRSNVELARIVGLSPAATLHRVRRLKESGVVRKITALLDPEEAGFPLRVFVSLTLDRHDEASHRRLERALLEIPQVIRADWVSGETDALLEMVARSIAEMQRTQNLLAARGGAARITTLLRMSELKPPSPLPLASDSR
jgi:Lrp/AsnC family transcriptional regulator, leucine-responsive regulatory protein